MSSTIREPVSEYDADRDTFTFTYRPRAKRQDGGVVAVAQRGRTVVYVDDDIAWVTFSDASRGLAVGGLPDQERLIAEAAACGLHARRGVQA